MRYALRIAAGAQRNMSDVFLSYKREDAAKVRKLVAALRGRGLDVWWDEDIPASAPWEATIERALAGAKAVVVCWSPDAVASENVRSEARVAREDGRLIQVFMKPCSPPLFFGERQGVDLSSWRGKADDPRIAKIAESVRKVAAGERPPMAERAKVRQWWGYRLHAAIAVMLILAGSLAGWWLLSPAKAEGPQTLAVLPFRASNPADADLVDAIWDDTRGAIARNPNLRVLGRQAVETLSKKDLAPAEYRRKVGADYLLDGSVQHAGDQVRMKLSLTRTTDSAEVWSDEIGGKLDDVFAFQQRIAREVEGRIRGRVAPGGGAVAKNIATTGEAYALYAQARGLILKRGSGHGAMGQARALLRRVLAIDPNYAPAWADLGESVGMGGGPDGTRQAIGYIKRALQLAPNLAHAHAALAMVQSTPPELEGELRKAVEIDPNDAEAWMWLGNCLAYQNRLGAARAAYSRAVEIEPLFYPAIGNLIGNLASTNDSAAMAAELARVEKLGDPTFLAKVKFAIAADSGHVGDAVRILLDMRARHIDETGWVDNHLAGPLLQLGFLDEVGEVWSWTPDVYATYRGNPGPPDLVKWGYNNRPLDFWQDNDAPALLGRLLPKHGRLREYRDLYAAAFNSPDELVSAFPRSQRFTVVAPTIAADLRAAGDAESADAILARADSIVAALMRNGPATSDLLLQMAFIRAAEGSDDEAVSLLGRAVRGGWLPDRQYYAIDIADEPAFARLLNRADFQAIRTHLLKRIEEERRKVSPAELAQAGFGKKAAA
jgi:TolB-like protein/Flp pilus assembly protein TadD